MTSVLGAVTRKYNPTRTVLCVRFVPSKISDSSNSALMTDMTEYSDFPPDHDDAVDILAYLITLTDGLIENGEVQRRIQRARHLTNSSNQRALLMLTGLIAGLRESLPDDDGWNNLGENRFGFFDVNISSGLPPLIHTLQVTDSLDLEQDSRGLIALANFGWKPVYESSQLLPDAARFDVLSNAVRHLMRRARMYLGVDIRLWEFVAYVGAAPEVDEGKMLKAVSPLKIHSGLYAALSVEVYEPPF